MFIAILVLLGLAGAIWYFARKQTQAIVTLAQEDVASVSNTNESAFTTPEVAAEKAFIQSQQDALAKAQEVAATVEEAPKPVKKKRRYYPKKK
jgi:cytoskeletal protein RodZ